jgi:hypothetical protein
VSDELQRFHATDETRSRPPAQAGLRRRNLSRGKQWFAPVGAVKVAPMEKVGQVFRSFADAERAERQFNRALTPAQRLEILFRLQQLAAPPTDETAEGFPRVYRLVKRVRR